MCSTSAGANAADVNTYRVHLIILLVNTSTERVGGRLRNRVCSCGVHSTYKVLGFLLIAVVCMFTVFVSSGPGPLSYFITVELVGQSARSGAQSWASVAQMLSASFSANMMSLLHITIILVHCKYSEAVNRRTECE
ncbi:hypothetical protein KIN20_008252 [Parelaphostrongylus tenuis]|uniref:Uncharacterized protein n=1 Tax=Parelaphostrongylus tenuis TaxID=148309 RepID=A0AAD5QHC8_PARTN|nr:hypothetical protein KIN20_008252 [Parelaphostrongylus tenuis]